VGRVLDGAEALELLGRERLASFDQVALAAEGPGLGSGPQQGAAKGAVVVAGGAGAGVQADGQPCKWTQVGEELVDVQRRWWGGADHRTLPAWKACGTGSCDGEDGSRQP
jgi:hypothetical protein